MKKYIIICLLSLTFLRGGIKKEWENIYSNDGWSSYAFYPVKILKDKMGNLYVGGNLGYETWTKVEPCAIFLVKYNNAGDIEWVNTYGFNLEERAEFIDMVIDEESNIYITGSIIKHTGSIYDHPSESFTLVTMKYSTHGGILWVEKYSDFRNEILESRPVGIALIDGEVYVGGYCVTPRFQDYILIKYESSTGEIQWVERNRTPKDDRATTMNVDHENNIYIGGNTSIDIDSYGEEIIKGNYIVKFNKEGKKLWDLEIDSYSYNKGTKGIVIDKQNSIYIITDAYHFKCNIYKYNKDGEKLWDKGIDNFRVDFFTCDEDNNLLLCGSRKEEACLLKISSDGTELWTNYGYRLFHVFYSYNIVSFNRITTDKEGNVYTVGKIGTYYTRPGNMLIIFKFTPDGKEIWKIIIDGNINNVYDKGINAEPGGILLDEDGNIFVTSSYGESSLLLSKYREIPELTADLSLERVFFKGDRQPADTLLWTGSRCSLYVLAENKGVGTCYEVRAYSAIFRGDSIGTGTLEGIFIESLDSLRKGEKKEIYLGKGLVWRNSYWYVPERPGETFTKIDSLYDNLSQDEYHDNNYLITHYKSVYDGEAVEIKGIPDTVWKGFVMAPIAVIKNNSETGGASFEVICSIEPGSYKDTQSIGWLPAGKTEEVHFNGWKINSTPSEFTITVTCQKEGDLDTTNNVITKTVICLEGIYEGNRNSVSDGLKTLNIKEQGIFIPVVSEKGLNIIEIFDINGKIVKRIEIKNPHRKYFLWNMKNHNGRRISAGVYFIKCSNEEKKYVKKVIIMD